MDGESGRGADIWVITVYCTNAADRRRRAHEDLLCRRGFVVI